MAVAEWVDTPGVPITSASSAAAPPPSAPLFDSARSARLAVGWVVWATLATGLMWAFDLMALSHVTLVLLATPVLAWRSYRLVGHPYYIALLPFPALPLLALALPSPLGSDMVRLVTIILPPLVATGAVLPLVSGRALEARRWQPLVVAAVAASLVWGSLHAWRVASAPTLGTPAGLALVGGCYRVHRGPAYPMWTNRTWPPAFARFDTARWVAPAEESRGMGDATSTHLGGPYWGERMIRSPDGTPGWWRPTGARFIRVDWTHRGLGGFRGSFRVEGGELVGAGEWFQDFRPPFWLPPRLLRVRLTPMDCAAMGPVEGMGGGR